MKNFLFRCDASQSIGSGHIIRCRTLARVLKQHGAAVTFLCRRQPGDLINLLRNEFLVLELPEQTLASCNNLSGQDLYTAWLGCSQDNDARDCLKSLSQAGISHASWLVVDHYGLDTEWESKILFGLKRNASIKLLAIDDLANRPHQADILLDQNFFRSFTQERYSGLVPEHCCQLLGPHYALLGPEYARLHPLIAPRQELRRVLVFFGGVDQMNLTCRALEALSTPELSWLAVDVVLGLQSIHRREVENLVSQRLNTTLHDPLPSLSGLICRADIAIGAGGSTTWERACLGLPSLVVTIADNQNSFAKALADAGTHHLLGSASSVGKEKIREALLDAVRESWPRACGYELTDGWGAVRLATALLGFQRPLELQPAISSDKSTLLQWCELKKWYQERKSSKSIAFAVDECNPGISANDTNNLQLIVRDSQGCPLGQIGINNQTNSTDEATCEAMIDISIDRCTENQRFDKELIRLGLQALQPIPDQAVSKVFSRNNYYPAVFAKGKLHATGGVKVTSQHHSNFQKRGIKSKHLTLISDHNSWINDYITQLIEALWQRGHALRWIHHPGDLAPGDICLMLSCSRILTQAQLALHAHNLVIHESALPKGQGWSPMTWQILKGDNSIPVTLFEATSELDAGPIYLQRTIELQGSELVDEWRALQAKNTFEMILDFLDSYTTMIKKAKHQEGESSNYNRRRPEDSLMDPKLSLSKQFNLLRVVDNNKYPAIVEIDGRRYQLKIHRCN